MITSKDFFFTFCKAYFAAMSKAKNSSYHILKGSSSYVVLFFALLLLTGSCPIKQFLKSGNTSSIQLKHGNKNSHSVSIHKNNQGLTCCYSYQDKIVKKNTNLQTTNDQHFIFSDYSAEKGFTIHTFLNGKLDKVYSYSPVSTSSLPRFLQHRRILV